MRALHRKLLRDIVGTGQPTKHVQDNTLDGGIFKRDAKGDESGRDK